MEILYTTIPEAVGVRQRDTVATPPSACCFCASGVISKTYIQYNRQRICLRHRFFKFFVKCLLASQVKNVRSEGLLARSFDVARPIWWRRHWGSCAMAPSAPWLIRLWLRSPKHIIYILYITSVTVLQQYLSPKRSKETPLIKHSQWIEFVRSPITRWHRCFIFLLGQSVSTRHQLLEQHPQM